MIELALSPDEKTVITAGRDLIAWDATTGKELWCANPREFGTHLQNASYGVRAVAFAPESTRFFTPGRPNEIMIWNTRRGTYQLLTVKSLRRSSSPMNSGARAVDVAPGGKLLALGRVNGVAVCDLGGNVRYEIANEPEGPAEFDGNDRLTFAGHYSLGALLHPTVNCWPSSRVTTPIELRLCDAETGRVLRTLELASRVVRLTFSPDSKQLATTEGDSAVRLYDIGFGDRIWSHVVKLTNISENYTSALAWSPNGKVMAVCATDNRIYFIDPSTGEETAVLAGHHWYPWAVAFTSDSKTLYSSGWDAFIRRWNVEARKQLPLPTGVRATGVVAASPDGACWRMSWIPVR